MREILPHQRVVTIHRWKETETKKRYCPELGDMCVVNALRRMNGQKSSGFLLWSILRMNDDGFPARMSDKTLTRDYGISKDVYLKGWDILRGCGFIIQEKGINYSFYELPEAHFKSVEILLIEADKRRKSRLSKGGSSDFQKREIPAFKSGKFLPDEHIKTLEEQENTSSPSIPHGGTEAAADAFERFWAVYPKKVKMAVARKEFEKLNPSDELLQTMIDVVEKAKSTDLWKRELGRYIPEPAKWIRCERWKDDLIHYRDKRHLSLLDCMTGENEEAKAEAMDESATPEGEHKPGPVATEKGEHKPQKSEAKEDNSKKTDFEILWNQFPCGDQEEAQAVYQGMKDKGFSFSDCCICVSLRREGYSSLAELLRTEPEKYVAEKKTRQAEEERAKFARMHSSYW